MITRLAARMASIHPFHVMALLARARELSPTYILITTVAESNQAECRFFNRYGIIDFSSHFTSLHHHYAVSFNSFTHIAVAPATEAGMAKKFIIGIMVISSEPPPKPQASMRRWRSRFFCSVKRSM